MKQTETRLEGKLEEKFERNIVVYTADAGKNLDRRIHGSLRLSPKYDLASFINYTERINMNNCENYYISDRASLKFDPESISKGIYYVDRDNIIFVHAYNKENSQTTKDVKLKTQKFRLDGMGIFHGAFKVPRGQKMNEEYFKTHSNCLIPVYYLSEDKGDLWENVIEQEVKQTGLKLPMTMGFLVNTDYIKIIK
ncbi:MAG: hypothetical protein KKA64_00875 [Nanoarchaeota archaeon]|nr:hypothetical protein [Nanoarchaeota archaeon]